MKQGGNTEERGSDAGGVKYIQIKPELLFLSALLGGGVNTNTSQVNTERQEGKSLKCLFCHNKL